MISRISSGSSRVESVVKSTGSHDRQPAALGVGSLSWLGRHAR
jgi:hypothetical protein